MKNNVNTFAKYKLHTLQRALTRDFFLNNILHRK